MENYRTGITGTVHREANPESWGEEQRIFTFALHSSPASLNSKDPISLKSLNLKNP